MTTTVKDFSIVVTAAVTKTVNVVVNVFPRIMEMTEAKYDDSIFRRLRDDVFLIEMPERSMKNVLKRVDQANSEFATLLATEAAVVSEAFSNQSEVMQSELQKLVLCANEVDTATEENAVKLATITKQAHSMAEDLAVKSQSLDKMIESNREKASQITALTFSSEALEKDLIAVSTKSNALESDLAKVSVTAEQYKRISDRCSSLENQARKERDIAQQKNKIMTSKLHCVSAVLEKAEDVSMHKAAKQALVKSVAYECPDEEAIMQEMEAMMIDFASTPVETPESKAKSSSSAQSSSA